MFCKILFPYEFYKARHFLSLAPSQRDCGNSSNPMKTDKPVQFHSLGKANTLNWKSKTVVNSETWWRRDVDWPFRANKSVIFDNYLWFLRIHWPDKTGLVLVKMCFVAHLNAPAGKNPMMSNSSKQKPQYECKEYIDRAGQVSNQKQHLMGEDNWRGWTLFYSTPDYLHMVRENPRSLDALYDTRISLDWLSVQMYHPAEAVRSNTLRFDQILTPSCELWPNLRLLLRWW